MIVEVKSKNSLYLGKSTWPKTKSGTIDWEVVFEDPETGLISIISKARSTRVLHNMVFHIASQIFTRKDDTPEIEWPILKRMNQIPHGMSKYALPRMVEGITIILREIKDKCILKADEYARHKVSLNVGDRRDAAKLENRRLRVQSDNNGWAT